MSLDNFQRKENTDSSLNTSKEATKEVTKETQNSLNSLDKKILISTIKWALETNILLRKEKGKENEITEYLLNGDYKSWKNREIDLILDLISSSDIRLYNIISKYIDPKYKQSLKPSIQQPTQAPSTNPEKSDNWLVNKMVSGAKETVSTIKETVSTIKETASTMVSGTMETVSTIADKISTAVDNTSELLRDFFWSVSRLVSIDGVPPNQIPILKATLEWWQKLFNKLYEYGWEWIGKTIDCSHLVSFALRAGGILMPNQYLNSTALYQKFSRNKIAKQSARAGDLMFWKKWKTIYHVEMVVWKPYQKEKNGKLEWCVKTLWSSSDTTGTSPMYNIDGTPSSKKNGVAYRERVIQGKHQFLRPQYENLVAENQKKKK